MHDFPPPDRSTVLRSPPASDGADCSESASPPPPRSMGHLDATHMVDDLRQWLNLTYDDVCKIGDIGAKTPFYWRRTGAKPRPSSLTSLLRLYALATALTARMGSMGAAAWLRVGSPSPLDLLRQHDFDTVEAKANALLFRGRKDRDEHYAAYAPEEEVDLPAPERPAPLSRTDRRPRRTALPRR